MFTGEYEVIEDYVTYPSYKDLDKVKVKLNLYTMQVQRRREGIAPTHYLPRHCMGMTGQHHVPAALYARVKNTQYPLDRRLVEPQCWFGHRG
jgi:hypothetical protein